MLRKIICILFLFMIFVTGKAQKVSQLNPFPFAIEQDNHITTIIRKGDYGNHWLETENGFRIFQKKEIFEYAISDNGTWKTSGIKVTENPEGDLKSLLERNARYFGVHNEGTVSLKSGNGIGEVPSTGEIKLPVICIEYSDLKHTRTKEDIEKMFNQLGYKGNLSLSEYFTKSSHGKLNLSFDVVGWVSTNDSYTNYSESEGMFNAGQVVKKAILAANSDLDFSKYDNDNDGDVDCVIIVHAGLGAEEIGDERYIWAHSWSLGGTGAGELNLDGKKIDSYNIGCELRRKYDAGIGMKCHEIGHALGLPDLYDGSEKSNGLGYWCMMSSAPWLNEARPGNFSAWCRVKLGWEEPIVKEYYEYDTLRLTASSNANQVIRINSTNENEYFLLENRQKIGIDYRLPGTGLAIYRCNQLKLESGTAVNNDRDNPGIKMIEADFSSSGGLYNAKDRGNAGDLFPGTQNKLAFGIRTIPSSNLIDNSYSGVNITGITEKSAEITFELKKPDPQIFWKNLVFRESSESKGKIENSIYLELNSAKWSKSIGVLSKEAYKIENLPGGLEPEIYIENESNAKLSLKGVANEHEANYSISNLKLTFLDAAFIETEASGIIDVVNQNLEIRYRDRLSDNIFWSEGFELYNVGESADSWTVEATENAQMLWEATAEENINTDAAAFVCLPAKGGRALKSLENWFGDGPKDFRLITPEIDFTSLVNPSLWFDEIRGWDNVWPEVKPVHHIDVEFSEDKTNWQKVTSVSLSEDNFTNWQSQNAINLSECEGKIGYLAFKSTSHTYYWEIDNVEIHTSGLSVSKSNVLKTQIYPNPATNQVWVESNLVVDTAELLNMYGNVVKQYKLHRNRSQLNINEIPAGLYFLRIIYSKGKSQVFKIQKQ